MDDELRQQIRECVQQEIAATSTNNRSPRPPNQSPRPPNRVHVSAQDLIERTRSIMQNAASSSTSSSPRTPNHPNRIGKKRKLVSKTTTHELQVVHPHDDHYGTETEHSISDSDICIKASGI